jgi:hypothetical protein
VHVPFDQTTQTKKIDNSQDNLKRNASLTHVFDNKQEPKGYSDQLYEHRMTPKEPIRCPGPLLEGVQWVTVSRCNKGLPRPKSASLDWICAWSHENCYFFAFRQPFRQAYSLWRRVLHPSPIFWLGTRCQTHAFHAWLNEIGTFVPPPTVCT